MFRGYPRGGTPSALLDAMSQELTRNFLALKDKADPPPYFLSYEITETEGHSLAATLGALESDNDGLNRTLDVSVRVGTTKLDNYHRVRGAGGAASSRDVSGLVPFDDNVNSFVPPAGRHPFPLRQRFSLQAARRIRL